MMHIGRVLFAGVGARSTLTRVLLLIPAFLAMVAATSHADVLDDMIQSFEQQEKDFNGLEVVGRLVVTQNGEVVNDAHVRAVYDRAPYTKVRVDFLRMKARWIDGAAPFSVDVSSHTYDGEIGQSMLYQKGSEVKPVFPFNGTIHKEKEMPGMIAYGESVSGWSYFAPALFQREGRSTAGLLRIYQQHVPSGKVEVKEDVADDKRIVTITISRGDQSHQILRFDGKRGFALLGKEDVLNGKRRESVEVTELKQVGPIYYPARVERRVFDGAGNVNGHQAFTLEVATPAKEPIPDFRFRIDWPENTTVTDERTGTTTRISKPAENAERVN